MGSKHSFFEKNTLKKEKKYSFFEGDFSVRSTRIHEAFHMDENFDIICKRVFVGKKRVELYSIDGFLEGDLAEKLLAYFQGFSEEEVPDSFDSFVNKCIPFADCKALSDDEMCINSLLSGKTCLLIEGFSNLLELDLKKYPSRSVEEPDKDKVLRGSRDGFVEALVPNVALIRRRIRDTNLIFSKQSVGRSSKTDIAVVYMKDRVQGKVLRLVKERIAEIDVDALTMNRESLAECLYPKKWFNPFPRFKYTERPDTAAACILEGSVVIMVDNSPSVMIVPTSLFDIIEDANDYYFPPITGTYLRLTRMIITLMALFLTPVFLLLIQNPEWIPKGLQFIRLQKEVHVPLIVQFLILELAVDGLKLASANTPSMLNTPLSIVAGIVFGDYTVDSGWFNAEVILYMAFVAVANYTQTNMELGYSIKFLRMQCLILTALFNGWGFLAGVVVIIVSVLGNHTMTGRNYLYPLIPFDGVQLLQRFFRLSLPRYEKIHGGRSQK